MNKDYFDGQWDLLADMIQRRSIDRKTANKYAKKIWNKMPKDLQQKFLLKMGLAVIKLIIKKSRS